jgi:hypothetical protein
MALVYANRRRLIVSWMVVAGIVTLVLLVRLLPQPWRGVVDAGVALALAYGAVAIAVLYARALAGRLVFPLDLP